MYHYNRERFRRSAPRAWVMFLLSLLIVAGLSFHMAHADPSAAGTETAVASGVLLVSDPPSDETLGTSPTVSHCHSPASCAFLPVGSSTVFHAPQSGGWIPQPPRYHRSTISDRQFRPPRLPVHV